ncbi:hypothetical protein DL96DRAFT_1718171 [Flagelloscypha sp. PMI_526]|nr:hypothetical protein DL96DRAFT_1718171 [Flagelloscypha sp. PMI_526]
MAEALAVTAVALAAPPCIRAVIDITRDTSIWVKVGGTLRLSSQAQSTLLSSRIFRVITKIRGELKKATAVLPAEKVEEFVEKLNRTIDLYNSLATAHSVADAKTRREALQSTKQASTCLLHDIKTFSRICANEKLVQAVKTCLYYDQNIAYPDGTIAAYHRDGLDPRPPPTPDQGQGTSDAEPTRPMLLPQPVGSQPTETVVNSTATGSSPPLSIPINFFFPLLATSNSSTRPDYLEAIPGADHDAALIDFGPSSTGRPGDSPSHENNAFDSQTLELSSNEIPGQSV